jgi:DNA-binding NarL/FixJ family response regulator
MKINILIADDHSIVRDGLKVVLSKKTDIIKEIFEAENSEELFKIADNKKIDIFIIDLEMPYLNGLKLSKIISQKYPQSSIIIFSTHSNKKLIEKAISIGVKGYLLKEDSTDNIVSAVKEVSKGNTFYSQKIANIVFESFLASKNSKEVEKKQLSDREVEILKLIVEGLSKKEIADKLNISVNTVNIHRKNIMGKLNIHNAVELTKYAIKEGIILL